jgi:hypothetical protein
MEALTTHLSGLAVAVVLRVARYSSALSSFASALAVNSMQAKRLLGWPGLDMALPRVPLNVIPELAGIKCPCRDGFSEKFEIAENVCKPFELSGLLQLPGQLGGLTSRNRSAFKVVGYLAVSAPLQLGRWNITLLDGLAESSLPKAQKPATARNSPTLVVPRISAEH